MGNGIGEFLFCLGGLNPLCWGGCATSSVLMNGESQYDAQTGRSTSKLQIEVDGLLTHCENDNQAQRIADQFVRETCPNGIALTSGSTDAECSWLNHVKVQFTGYCK